MFGEVAVLLGFLLRHLVPEGGHLLDDFGDLGHRISGLNLSPFFLAEQNVGRGGLLGRLSAEATLLELLHFLGELLVADGLAERVVILTVVVVGSVRLAEIVLGAFVDFGSLWCSEIILIVETIVGSQTGITRRGLTFLAPRSARARTQLLAQLVLRLL